MRGVGPTHMLRFFRRPPATTTRALKLYSVWPVAMPKTIDRPALVEGVLSASQRFFSSTPNRFDIHGPYGISKGRSVGIKAFRNKLAKRGHADYYGLEGYCEESFGFSCLFEAITGVGHRYDELLMCFAIDRHQVDVLDLAEALIKLFPSDYGFIQDFRSDDNVMAEARRKRTLFGYTLKEDPEHSRWRSAIPTVLDGKIRKVYRYNLLNEAQVQALAPFDFPKPVRVVNGMSMVWLSDDAIFESCKRRYSSGVPGA
jgi:hypothetical protein